MTFDNQVACIEQLNICAERRVRSLLISGPEGCGKSYLANLYGRLLNIYDVTFVNPAVNDLRAVTDSAQKYTDDILIVVENLDEGTFAASSALLKILEEPPQNVYMVVTARNLSNVQDTIISRCICLIVGPPTSNDIQTYCNKEHTQFYNMYSNTGAWKIIRSFNDVKQLGKYSVDTILDILSRTDKTSSKEAVSNISWNLNHDRSGTEIDAKYVIRSIYTNTDNTYMKKACMQALFELNRARIGVSAVLTKLAFEIKYGG